MLFNVMKAYAVCDPEVGYCQGSAFLAGMLLLHMPEEDAFSVFMKLMSKGSGKIDLRSITLHLTHQCTWAQLRMHQFWLDILMLYL